MTTIDAVNIALESFAIVVSLLMLLSIFSDRVISGKRTWVFFLMVITNILVLLFDLLTWVYDGNVGMIGLLYTSNFLVYSLGYVIMALFTYFVAISILKDKKYIKIVSFISGGLALLAIILVVVSLFNHMYFYFDEAAHYQRGSLYLISQIYPIAVLGFNLVFIIVNHKGVSKRMFYSLLSYGLLPILAMFIQIFVYGVTLLYLGTTLGLLIIYLTMRIQLAIKLQENELALQQAQVSVMMSQIQPHFLYNSLASIKELCKIDPEKAELALDEFSDFLRGNMSSLSLTSPISFSQELEHTKNYLSLESLRFGERVQISYDLKVTEFSLPALSLEPLVENAIKHGITKKVQGGHILISTYEGEKSIYVSIQDDGVGFDPSLKVPNDGKSHVGIANVKQRLASMSHGSLTVESEPNKGTLATIALPKEDKA